MNRAPDIEPYVLPYSDAAVEDLHTRLARTRWPDEIPGSGWEYGIDLDFMRNLCRYWKERFDWKSQVKALSAFHHYRGIVGGERIHFIHERGKGARADSVDSYAWLARLISGNAQDYSIAY